MSAATSTFDQLAGPMPGAQPVFADYLLVVLFSLLALSLAVLPFAGRERMHDASQPASLSAPAQDDLTNSFLP